MRGLKLKAECGVADPKKGRSEKTDTGASGGSQVWPGAWGGHLGHRGVGLF